MPNNEEIELGDKVKCIYTGFTGIATARTEFINGCVQYMVAGKWDGKTQDIPEIGIDSQSLKIVSKKKKLKEEESNGGPMRVAFKQRGY